MSTDTVVMRIVNREYIYSCIVHVIFIMFNMRPCSDIYNLFPLLTCLLHSKYYFLPTVWIAHLKTTSSSQNICSPMSRCSISIICEVNKMIHLPCVVMPFIVKCEF